MKEPASNREWRKWGETDPLFGVASWPGRNQQGASPWTDEEFYRLGESDWQDFRSHWERYGVDRQSCVEIGCGAGRITKQLASFFGEVHALDVSDKMIEYAQRHVSAPCVTFHISNGTAIPLRDGQIDAAFSAHVFQHFDSLSVAQNYFAEMARVLKPGGTLMIHLPIHQWPAMSRTLVRLYALRRAMRDLVARGKRLLMDRGLGQPIMRNLSYPLEFVYRVLPQCGLGDIEIMIFSTRSNLAPHSFVFARKQNASEPVA